MNNSSPFSYPLILDKLETYVQEHNLRILIARNYSTLPAINPGRDVDMIIKKDDINIWISLFRAVASDLNLNMRIGARYAYCIKLFLSKDSSHELEFDLLPEFCP